MNEIERPEGQGQQDREEEGVSEIERRVAALKATQQRYEGKEFSWRRGVTCIHMVRHHARNMGHRLTLPRFRSQLGALRELNRAGFETLPEYLDSMFPRIPPAMMLVGDVMATEGDTMFEALLIRGSVRKYLGWHEDAPSCTVIDGDMTHAVGAWRL